jgi:hypothetical protein
MVRTIFPPYHSFILSDPDTAPSEEMIEVIGGKYIDLTFLYRFSDFFHDETVTSDIQKQSSSKGSNFFF